LQSLGVFPESARSLHVRQNGRVRSWPALAAAAAAAVLVTGCGTLLGAPAPAAPGPPAAQAQTCTFGATGADVEVQFTDDATPCSQQEQALATFGLSWYPVSALIPAGSAGTADGETMQTTCVLSKGGSTMTVEDAGGMDYGQQICSSNEQGGWTATGAP
jgi:hypothetical protein